MKRILLLLGFPVFAFAQPQPPPFNSNPEYLDKNNVRAQIVTTNNKFWDIGGNMNCSYEVPKGKGVHAQFGNSLWIGGLDAQSNLHIAANTYRQNGSDFWPGPLDTVNIATYDSFDVAKYNRLWKVDCDDINKFALAFSNGSVAANTYTIPEAILNYPATGISHFTKKLAPFKDANNDGLYSPQTSGDYPIIRGHQQILSIYNDNTYMHTETMGQPMGLEIRERSYAFRDTLVPDSVKAINYTTFYHYEIINRSPNNYFDVYIADWSDVDVGYWANDYIGTDTLNHFTYAYNSGTFDPTAMGVNGYQSRPPVISHALMKTNCASDGIDNNHNQLVDEPGEQFLLDRSTYYNNNIGTFPPATTNPTSALNYYNFMKGIWKNGNPFSYGGNAYGGFGATRYVYPGSPPNAGGWTEVSAGNAAGDRRVISTSGPFNFPAGAKIEWSYAIVFSQDTTAGVNTISQFNSRVQRDVRVIRQYHDNHLAPQCLPPITVGLSEEQEFSNEIRLFPNPAQNFLGINLLMPRKATIAVFDALGRQVIRRDAALVSREMIDVSALEPGVYAIVVDAGKEKMVRKFVKQ